MYVAGLNLTLAPTATSPGLVEPLLYTTTLFTVGAFVRLTNQRLNTATEKGGEIKRMPTTFLGKFITPVHGVSTLLSPVLYLFTLPFAGFRQPDWLLNTALPEIPELGDNGKIAVRLASAVALLCAFNAADKIVKALDKQFHFIGVREKPKIIDTGAYGLVRHPLYTVVAAMQVIYAPLIWNYIPLVCAAVTATAFAIKIPIEENLLETDATVAADYREYKKKVPYRLIPYIW